MQKYYITNGKEYIKKIGRKYNSCSSPVLADTYAAKTAENILRNRLCKAWKETFYLEGVDDFERISLDNIDTQTVASEVNKIEPEDKIIKEMEQLVTTLNNLCIPPKIQLLSYKKELEKSESFYDRALSDIDHWIMDHKPPAHVRAKVYGIQRDIEQKRKQVKEKYGYILVLINADEKEFCVSRLQHELKKRKYAPYTPNTYVYKMLDDLLNLN